MVWVPLRRLNFAAKKLKKSMSDDIAEHRNTRENVSLLRDQNKYFQKKFSNKYEDIDEIFDEMYIKYTSIEKDNKTISKRLVGIDFGEIGVIDKGFDLNDKELQDLSSKLKQNRFLRKNPIMNQIKMNL